VDEARGASRSGGFLQAVLGVPLFYKLLVANSLVVIFGAIVGTAVTAEFVRASPERSTLELVGWLAAIGTLISVGVNAAIIRWALVPLGELERTANAVRAGELDARARVSPLADRDFRRLTGTFNAMLDRAREHRARLSRIASEATRATEAERKRIARELHDGTAQDLAALLVHVRMLADSQDAEERQSRLVALRQQLAGTLKEVRRTAHALRPEALEELGLGAAIQRHARSIEAESDARVEVLGLPTQLRLAPDVELAAYRVVQEAMTNAARHAHASRIGVHVRREHDDLEILVEDDGRGFDVEEAMSDRERLGLFGMRERAAYFDGRVEIRSRPGSGTSVRLILPLTERLSPSPDRRDAPPFDRPDDD
jgi:two-component system sensor histidine kinase UhpB